MKRIGILFFALFLAIFVFAQRDTISLDGKWNFTVDSMKVGLKNKWYIQLNNTNQQIVTVPHTWNVTEKLERYFGWAWYQRKIFVPKSNTNAQAMIVFHAVYRDATVWVNGKKVGVNKGSGFTKFSFDVSKHIVKGKDNTISVLVDNSFSNNSLPFQKSFDWPNDGGIIRTSYILLHSIPFVDNLIVTPQINFNTKAGVVNANLKLVSNKSVDYKKLKLKVEIIEENQKTKNTVFKGTPEYTKIQNGQLNFSVNLTNVNAWHFDAPNLYKIKVEVYDNQKITDVYTSTFGFRELRTSGYDLYFNNEKIRLAGIEAMFGSSLKNGMAETHDELRNYLEKLKKHNAIFTRFHWQQDEFVLDWCDRNGMLVQAEIPVWGHKTFYTDTILDIAKSQLQTMITDQHNHACIVAWGVGNEVDARKKINIDGVQELTSFVKSTDSTRLVNYVSNTLQQARHWMPKGTPNDASEKGDILMYNDYHSTWYRQAMAGIGSVMDTIKVENRPMPLIISEFGLCEPENWGNDDKRITDMIYYYAVYESKPHIAGTIYFCLNDYRTHMGGGMFQNHTVRNHGVYDMYGKPKKSADVLTEMNSPIEMSGLNRNKSNQIEVTLVASNGIPSFVVRGYKAYWSKDIQSFSVSSQCEAIPDLAPGLLHTFRFENVFENKGAITVLSPTGRIVYQKQVEQVDPYF